MQSELNSGHYTDRAVFEKEQTAIFRRLWLFAGLRSALAAPNAFITRTIGGLPVLIQNCEGEIRAFSNQCPHRLMPLQTEEFGQARMVCPYHGWSFNGEGSVQGMPGESTLYQYSPEERARLRLTRYAVEVVGNMVFVNVAPEPLPIEAQFSPEMLAHLQAMSSHFGAQAMHVNIDGRHNWKLHYENVLDGNHVPYVHPKSFSPLLPRKISDPVKDAAEARVPPVLATLAAQSFYAKMPLAIERFPWHDMVRRYGEGDYYHNTFLFPNINFCSIGGLVFLVQQLDPIAPDHTQIRFTLALAEETQRLPSLPAILRGHMRGEVDVLYEDVLYLEALQANLHKNSSPVQHGQYEQRLASFAKVYANLLEGGRPW